MNFFCFAYFHSILLWSSFFRKLSTISLMHLG